MINPETETREARILALARAQALTEHVSLIGTNGHQEGMSDLEWGFTTCSHPDCVLVREALALPAPSEEPPHRHDENPQYDASVDGLRCSCGAIVATRLEADNQPTRFVPTPAPAAEARASERTWTCFHCDETFANEVAAREHFGSDEGKTAACKIAAGDGGLLKALRESEREVGQWQYAHEQSDYEASRANAMDTELRHRFGADVKSVYQAWLRYEAMESRAMAAEERAALGGSGLPQWQPIETEPKLNDPFFAYSPEFVDEDYNPEGIIEACWNGEDGYLGAIWDGLHDCWRTEDVSPTHWMKRPAPPLQAAEEK